MFVFFSDHAVRASGHLLDQQRRPKFDSPKWREHEGLSLHLLRTAKESAKGAKSSSAPEPSPSRPNPPPVKPAPPKPPARRYLTSLPNSITGSNSSAVSSSLAESPASSIAGTISGAARKISGASSATSEPQIQAETALEEVIRRPMLPQPPIEGNLDCRTGIPFRALLRLSSSELAQSFQLLRGAANRSHLLRGELPPVMFLIDAFLRHNIYPLQHWTQRRGVLLEALYKMSEGFFFGPHHLIMAALLYFEEKVHKKKLRADCIPLLFPRLLCQILEHLGYPSEPQLERKRICREPFTLDKWNNMTAYKVDQPGQPQPAARRASPRHIPEPSTSAEPRMAIPISEYRELCRALETLTASQSSLAQEMAAIRACQEQMLATQAQQAAILRQLQVHFDLPQAVEPSTDTPQSHTSSFRVSSSRAQAPADAPTEEGRSIC
ncbi:hypothetical protein CK203_103590, partial [Vitis vinifera]